MAKGRNWTNEELLILEEEYKKHKKIEDIIDKLPNRTKDAISLKIQKLGLNKKYPNPRTWTDEEIEILKNGYSKNETAKQIAEKLPNRNASTVHAKAIDIGIITPKPNNYAKWTEEEIKILTDMYLSCESIDNSEIYKMLPNHPPHTIVEKASKLGLSKQRQENINKSLIGKRFGRWTVLYDCGVINGYRMVHCKCDCGNERDVDLSNLKAGISSSCGCLRDETSIINGKNNKKENSYDITSNDYGIGWTDDNYAFYFDIEDLKYIKPYCWHRHSDGYLRTCYSSYYDENGARHNKYIMMHQLLSNHYFDGEVLDHINGRTYDNRKENLRPVIHIDNSKNLKISSSNKSGHKGVWQTPNGSWIAYITCDRVRHHLGTFNDYEDAVRVREKAETELFKEYNREKEYLNG